MIILLRVMHSDVVKAYFSGRNEVVRLNLVLNRVPRECCDIWPSVQCGS